MAVYPQISDNLDDESEVYRPLNFNLQIPVVSTEVVIHSEFTYNPPTPENLP
ncbi:hypothetical protein BYT27DRAFT_7202237 [Phlegmacium glaucopus]|nr:hypothetical protein BYT27DRAFT_7202237 [Phlegmacium glaucopus]